MVNILNPNGTLNANAGKYQGMTVLAARKQVVADLESQGLVVAIEDRLIDLAHSDRSKTPIEPYLADQWFVKMDRLAQAAMQAVTDGRVKILPERYTKGYLDWLAEKRDWPVSRQLWWGHQIPVWSITATDQAECDHLLAALRPWCDEHADLAALRIEEDEELAAAKAQGGDEYERVRRERPVATLHVCLKEDRVELAAATGSRGPGTQPGSAGHLVQLRPLAPFDAGLAGTHAGAGLLLPHQRADHQPRHHHAVGGPDGADGPEQHGRSPVPGGVHPPEDPGRLRRDDVQVEGQRDRPAGRDRQVRRGRLAVWHGPLDDRNAGRADARPV